MSKINSVYEQIKKVMDNYDIPAYIWAPIAASESSFNQYAHALNSSENSMGLFQINIVANPQYSSYDLYDATTNSNIAAQNFILPAFNYAKTVTSDPLKQAEIVYSGLKNPDDTSANNFSWIPAGGIMPAWTAALKQQFDDYFTQYSGGAEPIIDTNTPGADTTGKGGTKTTTTTPPTAISTGAKSPTPSITSTITGNIVHLFIIVGVLIMLCIAMFKMFSETKTGAQVIEVGKDAITKSAQAAAMGA